jgi:hypothetical protein
MLPGWARTHLEGFTAQRIRPDGSRAGMRSLPVVTGRNRRTAHATAHGGRRVLHCVLLIYPD